MVDCFFLESIELEGPLARHIRHEFLEVGDVAIDVNHMSPLSSAFPSRAHGKRAVRSQRRELYW